MADSFSELVLVFDSEAVETAYSDFTCVSVPLTFSFVFVTVPEMAPVGTCGWPSLFSCTGTAVLVCLGASDTEDWTFGFEMPN